MDFETAAVRAKEDRIMLFRRECMLASVAVANEAAAWLAELWGSDVSTQSINRRAQIWDTFPLESVLPDTSLALYGAALDAATIGGTGPATEYAVAWLEEAIRQRWSPRQLRDHADILWGKHLSGTKFEGEVEVTTWNPATGDFAVKDLPISGDMPKRARVTVREVLSEKGEQ